MISDGMISFTGGMKNSALSKIECASIFQVPRGGRDRSTASNRSNNVANVPRVPFLSEAGASAAATVKNTREIKLSFPREARLQDENEIFMDVDSRTTLYIRKRRGPSVILLFRGNLGSVPAVMHSASPHERKGGRSFQRENFVND